MLHDRPLRRVRDPRRRRRRLGRHLADFKVTSEVHPMPEGQHSFVLGAGRVPEVDQAIQQMGQWLRKHLGA
ncbi:hypothetical protein ACFPH6_34700 [Streptomyces xiangluensis]|uniref:Alpha/beta hydrolase fold-3 domain-containing protein n=1 Tax=Streptomyces xiangluensis TaxID=2665720 RepID=A0ABV8YZ94_9ACTN